MYDIKETLSEIIITIYNKANSKSAIGFFVFFAATSLIIPIVIFIILTIKGNGIQFGFIITCIAFIGVFCYLFRLILWNIYGKEIITLTKDELSIINDYRFLKDKVKIFPFSSINIMYNNGCEKNTDTDVSIKSNIYFKTDKETVVINCDLPIFSIEEISEKIFSFLNDRK